MFLALAFLTLLVEVAIGYPDVLYRAIGHPVTWMGKVIAWLDRNLNRDNHAPQRRKLAGVGALLLLLLLAIAAGLLLQWGLSFVPFGIVIAAILASSLIAQRSLHSHVAAVATALERDGLGAGRKAVSQIVGRDPDRLDEAAVCRAAIESLAENFSDGIVAPAFWLAVGGLPGALAYKTVNTADSMIGHKNLRHRDFGWAAARFDDLVNLPASRLSALLIIGAALAVPGASPGNTWRAVLRDAGKHRSPNAGWPEAAMAGALGLSLAGARHYGGVRVDDAEMGAGGRRELAAADIRRALQLYRVADLLLVALLGIAAGAFIWHGR
jgi:adenosylcobinamide-phosphate synthase